MADDYLGRKMEEYMSRPAKQHRTNASLAKLLAKNRSSQTCENKLTLC